MRQWHVVLLYAGLHTIMRHVFGDVFGLRFPVDNVEATQMICLALVQRPIPFQTLSTVLRNLGSDISHLEQL
jgi:hypothetical protein